VKQELAASEAAAKQAKETQRHWETVADEAKKKAAEDMIAAEEQAKAQEEKMKKKVEKLRKEHEKKLADQAAKAKRAMELAKAEAAAAAKLRKAEEARLVAKHKKQMQERRDEFKKLYTHVWIGGLSGISSFTFTMPDKRVADNLITKLFEDTLIADVTEYNSRVRKTFNKYGKMQLEEGMVQIKGVTSDLRVSELIEAVFEAQKKEHFVAEYDIITQPISTGSKEYIQWVRDQCLAKNPALSQEEPPSDQGDHKIATQEEVADKSTTV
jgi:uncharacterized protein involved in tolerance to divalent cations